MFLAGWSSFEPFPFAFVALAPLWAAVETVRERSWVQASLAGWCYGLVALGLGYHWMIPVVREFAGYATIATVGTYLAFVSFLSLQYAVHSALYRKLRNKGWLPAIAAVPTLVCTEWLFPGLFPTYVSNLVVSQPLLIQTADLGGPLLVSAIVGMVNVLLLECLRWRRGKRAQPTALAAVTLTGLLLTLVYGAIRMHQVEAQLERAPVLALGVVQSGIGIDANSPDAALAHRLHLRISEALEREGDVDLLVWPEASYRYSTFERLLPLYAPEVRGSLRAPILFGGASGIFVRDMYEELHNSALLVDEIGVIGQRYDKNRLFPLGEYIPFGDRFPALYGLVPNSARFHQGTGFEPFQIGPWRTATPICYEDLLPQLVRRMVLETNPHVLINITNDAWFGDSEAPRIHFRMSQFRAVEHRRYLVRATSTGVSGTVDPTGRAVLETEVGDSTGFRTEVALMDGTTWYTRLGDWPGWVSLVVCLLLWVRRPRRPIRRISSD